jgi:hypothetical protein
MRRFLAMTGGFAAWLCLMLLVIPALMARPAMAQASDAPPPWTIEGLRDSGSVAARRSLKTAGEVRPVAQALCRDKFADIVATCLAKVALHKFTTPPVGDANGKQQQIVIETQPGGYAKSWIMVWYFRAPL